MKKIMVVIAIIFASALIMGGCSGLTGEIDDQNSQHKKIVGPTHTANKTQNDERMVCNFTFTDTPDAPCVWDIRGKGVKSHQIVSLFSPIVNYRMSTGSWPDSWDDLREGYLPLIPVDPYTGKDMILADYEDTDGTAPANFIVAEWADDGCDIYIAKPVKNGWGCVALNKYLFQKAIVTGSNEPGKAGVAGEGYSNSAYRLSLIVRAWMDSSMSFNFGIFGELPSSTEDLMYGFRINPDFLPGYVPNDETCGGKFIIATKPEEKKYLFRCYFDNPRETVNYPFQIVGKRFSQREPFQISSEVIQGMNLLLTEEAFFQ